MKSMPVLKFLNLDSETHDLFTRMFHSREGALSEINPSGAILPTRYKDFGQDILEMEVRSSDVWLCSYPRTGSTWAQEMVWLIANDLDYEGCKKSLHEVRCPRLEKSLLDRRNWNPNEESNQETSVDVVKSLPDPRFVRTHLHWDILPVEMENTDGSVKPKVIYTYRNPKDVVVSYYHYCSLVYKINGTFEEFCELFMKDQAPFGSFWSHLFAFWNRRNDPNVLLIKYEDMKRDHPSVVRRTAQFFNKQLTDAQVNELCEHLSFKQMKTNKAVNFEDILEKAHGGNYLETTDLRFIRKGEIGDWKNYMSDDLSRRFDEWVDQKLKGTELSFE